MNFIESAPRHPIAIWLDTEARNFVNVGWGEQYNFTIDEIDKVVYVRHQDFDRTENGATYCFNAIDAYARNWFHSKTPMETDSKRGDDLPCLHPDCGKYNGVNIHNVERDA